MTDSNLALGRPSGEGDRQRLGEILAECFNFPAADAAGWFDYAGHDNLRVLRRQGEVVGGLVGIPMGQFFGGRSVQLYGVAGVGITPWARGGGAATRMMADALREARQAGYPLAGLYPATQTVYRRVGFEQAGLRCELRVPLSAVPVGERTQSMRPFTPADLPALQALYREVARTRHGWLERGPYVWHRVRYPRGMTSTGYVLEEAGQVGGYVFLARVRRPEQSFNYDLVVVDFIARSEAGWRRLLTFLADHDSIAGHVSWFGGANDPLVLLFRDQPVDIRVLFHWMIRVLDVPAALSGRGYPRGLSATLHLDVTDALLPDNTGRWVLEVSGGEARVRRGGEGHLRCDVRTLAALYSGYRSASQLSAMGVLQATPEALEQADVLFMGPTPCMPDMY